LWCGPIKISIAISFGSSRRIWLESVKDATSPVEVHGKAHDSITMLLLGIGRKLRDGMDSLHEIRSSGLSEIIQYSHNAADADWAIEVRRVRIIMENPSIMISGNEYWYWLVISA
jgi:hypothetical protein